MPRYSTVLAKEYDAQAVSALYATLGEMGAVRLWRRAGHGGSQEVDFRWYLVRFRIVSTRSETYFGLKLVGPTALVESIAAALKVRLNVAVR